MTLDHSLNDEVKRVNLERKEDAATTKSALDNFKKPLNKRMDPQFVIVQSMHESHLHLEENLKLLTNKVGITTTGEKCTGNTTQETNKYG